MRLWDLGWQRRRDARDADLDDEIRGHFAMAIAERIAHGESPEEAAAAARREFGNVGHVKEVTRESWGGVWIERSLQDLRYAFRALRRNASFAVVAILTLALGIGVNTTMFSVMRGVLLRPLPFPQSDRLFVASYTPPKGPFNRFDGLYDAHFRQFLKAQSIFDHVTTFSSANLALSGSGEPASVTVTSVTPDFFTVFGATPRSGRAFSPDEAREGRDNVVIVSDAGWHRHFGGNPRIVGSTITLEGKERTVVGVMPPQFTYPDHADLLIPLDVVPLPHEIRLRAVVGRLKAGITPERAAAAFAAMAVNFDMPPGFDRHEFTPKLIPLKQVVIGDARRPLLIFSGAVAFVLLIACANVANLVLMRVSARDRELAVRAALGAGRARLIRQLLTETFALTLLGSLLGVALAFVGMRALLALAPSETIPRAESVHLDTPVLLFTAGLSVVTAVLCGFAPAMRATESRLRASLAEGARALARSHGRLRGTLVVAEVALAIVLLTGAGLLLRSFERMRSVDLGFHPASVLTATVDLPNRTYRTSAEMQDFQTRVLDGLSRIPGASSVAAVNWIPLGGNLIAGDFQLEGVAEQPAHRWADKMVVSDNYFRTMGVTIHQGRGFTEDDRAGNPKVVVISRAIANRFWPQGDALGKRVAMTDKPTVSDWWTIVGVASDVVQTGLTAQPDAAIYQPLAQTTQQFFLQHVSFIVRRSDEGREIAPAMRQVVRRADPNLPLRSIVAMTDLIDYTILVPRFQARILLTFALFALALAVVGIYGVLAYGVAQRRREIGIRLALGAVPSDVRRLVLHGTARLVIPGVVIGIAASLVLTRLLSTFLFQVKPTDPATFIAVTLFLALVAFAAAYAPARRASRVDPLLALRAE